MRETTVNQPQGLRGRRALIGGATSTAGRALARALVEAGALVVATGRDEERLAALRAAVPGVETVCADVTHEDGVAQVAALVRERFGAIDAVVPLVGGWRGGGGLAGQSEEDFRVMETSLSALRHLSRAFFPDLAGSPAGRLVFVSSTRVARPLAGGANYAAVKAAGEAWMQAVAHGFAKDARDGAREMSGAASVIRAKSLAEHESDLARLVVELLAAPAQAINGEVVQLGHQNQEAR